MIGLQGSYKPSEDTWFSMGETLLVEVLSQPYPVINSSVHDNVNVMINSITCVVCKIEGRVYEDIPLCDITFMTKIL